MAEPKRNFMEMLQAKYQEGKFVCLGLDSEYRKLPESVRIGDGSNKSKIYWFNCRLVNHTYDLVCAYKLKLAFYLEQGVEGMQALKDAICHIRSCSHSIPVILDGKFGDIGDANNSYAQMAFEYCGVDAITVHPYLGREALQPFLDRENKGIFVLCRNFNPGAGEFQDLGVFDGEGLDRYCKPLYQIVAKNVAENWNNNNNCGLVVGAVSPEELCRVRKIVGDMPILIPEIGAQSGNLEKTIIAGKDSKGQGIIINSSREIIFASQGEDFAQAARRETQKLHEAITSCLQKGNG
jgi:orotidine-5'-phosphate decarboxylase